VTSAASSWMRYRGDGTTPSGVPAQSRGEHGRYLADERLVTAVNTALAVGQPILVTGEPGTGKTMLAWSIASELGLGDVLEFHTRSDNQARDALYEFDYMLRFYHAQIRDARAEQLESYIRWQALGEAIRSPTERVVLIDEIDKAPRDFPNDLLDELDKMEFRVPELALTHRAVYRPVVVITSNSERQLPDPFLRRCVFHRIDFPSGDRLRAILQERLGYLNLSKRLVDVATERFEQLRLVPGFEKLPSTAELIAWVRVLHAAGVDLDTFQNSPLFQLPFPGALIKSEQDSALLANQRTVGR
jgi:MoxR-like ATPase